MLRLGQWRKPTRCNGYGGNDCVEATAVAGGAAIRDSKDAEGPVLTFTAAGWTAFIEDVQAGEFDRPAARHN